MSAEFGTRIFKPSRDDKESLDYFQIKVLLKIYTIYSTEPLNSPFFSTNCPEGHAPSSHNW
jgi:hypothetical protein